ncbi:hypothetical protein PV371_06705 [Streptomyces sp. TX20-6-3]|uniref:hypothetical protein n=1 Tax=Streptomyces sp. TX20-6-3 TaxID=3028705 RepID=UPI0029B6602B|nr:hypothetical protein [Streptomyces sp. TX20-6-3]MDX2559337.1 hypothetical protein [Streptomyces sp. TX20-6-3]
MSTKIRRYNAAMTGAGVVAVGCGMTVALRLDAYMVPLWLSAPCGYAITSGLITLAARVISSLDSAVYACTVPGCTFSARLRWAGPAERRRWQEAAAAHPAHDIPRP